MVVSQFLNNFVVMLNNHLTLDVLVNSISAWDSRKSVWNIRERIIEDINKRKSDEIYCDFERRIY